MSHLICCAVLAVTLGCSGSGHSAPEFDGGKAFALLVDQVDFGPRVPGTAGHRATSQFIQEQLKPYADGVLARDFSAIVGDKTLPMTNIVAWFKPADNTPKKWVLLAAHWDTRPRADNEITSDLRKKPIPGANDGASGVAVLLELARLFHQQRPEVGVFMVFFDGEDYGRGEAGMFLGSKRFASDLRKNAVVDGKPIEFSYGILLDMVGDKNLGIYREGYSVEHAPEIVDKVWSTAERLGYAKVFRDPQKHTITDDHLPLLRAGVKCINIIDFDYGPWHTLDDTPERCSPESLRTVGRVVAAVVYGER